MKVKKPDGIFSASMVSQLCAEGTGKTRQKAILNCVLKELGLYIDFDNEYMKHGRANEPNAFKHTKKKYASLGKFRYVSKDFIFINDNFGATPDIILNSKIPCDIKCPKLETFEKLEVIRKMLKAYVYQLQSQMMAMKAPYAILFNYLIKPEKWGEDDWQDYPFEDENDRSFEIVLEEDKIIQQEILDAVESATKERKLIKAKVLQGLNNEISFRQRRDLTHSGMVIRPLSDASRIARAENVFSFDKQLFFYN